MFRTRWLLSLLLIACTSGRAKPPLPDDFGPDGKADVSSQIGIQGSLSYGASDEYMSSPQVRSLTFWGNAGDNVDIWVRAVEDGDPVAYLLDPRKSEIAQNDDADDSTSDSHLVATLPSDGTYTVAWREYSQDATETAVTVSLNLAGIASCDLHAQPPPAAISANAGSDTDDEPTIAVDGQGGVVVAWNSVVQGKVGVSYAVSRNNGATFSRPTRFAMPRNNDACDPSLAVDSQGQFYLAMLAGTDANGRQIWLAELPPHASRFGTPRVVSSDGANTGANDDRPFIAVAPQDLLLVLWNDIRDYPASQKLMFARSSDSGKTWSKPLVLASGNVGANAMCVDPITGYVFVPFGDNGGLSLLRSTDGAESFERAASSVSPATDASFCLAWGDNVWLVHGIPTNTPDCESTALSSVSILKSEDDGSSFSPETSVFSRAGSAFYFPAFAYNAYSDGSGRRLHVIAYEVPGAADSPNGKASRLVRASSDDGTGWIRSVVTSTGTFDAVRSDNQFFGDYITMASTGSRLYASYSALDSKGIARIFFRRLCP
jgi:hypothetical protein